MGGYNFRMILTQFDDKNEILVLFQRIPCNFSFSTRQIMSTLLKKRLYSNLFVGESILQNSSCVCVCLCLSHTSLPLDTLIPQDIIYSSERLYVRISSEFRRFVIIIYIICSCRYLIGWIFTVMIIIGRRFTQLTQFGKDFWG